VPREIERKFLVVNDLWRTQNGGTLIRQGYLCASSERAVRVKIAGEQAFLTIKGPTLGITRAEFEYQIPLEDAGVILDTLAERPLIEKRRHEVYFAGHVWEVDDFLGENAGLVVAEVELEDAAAELQLPPWVGGEVSHDPRYLNANLMRQPYSSWAVP